MSLGLRFWGIALGVAFGLACQTNSSAQEVFPPFEGSGKIIRIESGAVEMTTDAAEKFVVGIPATAKISVAGPAEQSFLTSGTLVRFSVDLDAKMLPKSEVSEVTVVEVSETIKPGVYADSEPGEKKEPGQTTTYVIVGKVKSCKNGTMQVAGGKKSLKVKLAEGATINVDITTYLLAQADDKIKVYGKLAAQGKVMADEVAIEIQKPLTAQSKKDLGKARKPSKKPPKPPKPKKTTGKTGPKDSDAKPDGEAAKDGAEAQAPDEKTPAKP